MCVTRSVGRILLLWWRMAVVKINPMKLSGPWTAGFVLDYHSVSAVPTGDPYHPFDIKRTDLGELLYRFKYGGDRNVIGDIVDTVEEFIGNWKPVVDGLVPAPPSLKRNAQPVVEVARRLATRLNFTLWEDAVRKVKETPSMKNVADWYERQKLLAEAIQPGRDDVAGKSVLLFDDLIQSGSTLGRAAEVLQGSRGANAVYVLALTRTR
jgi:predicted amidophosphoribosyltransferase